MNSPYRLTDGDKHSETWARLKKHISERREYLRSELEKDHSEQEFAKLRGRLQEIRLLLDLDREQPNLPPT